MTRQHQEDNYNKTPRRTTKRGGDRHRRISKWRRDIKEEKRREREIEREEEKERENKERK